MDFKILTDREIDSHIVEELKKTMSYADKLLNENIILFPLVEGLSTFKIDNMLLKNLARLSKKENTIIIELINSKDKTQIAKALKQNASLPHGILHGIDIQYDADNIVLVWPIITMERKRKAIDKVKSINTQVIDYAREIRHELKKACNTIVDKGKKARVEKLIEKEFTHCKEQVDKKIELAIVRIEKI